MIEVGYPSTEAVAEIGADEVVITRVNGEPSVTIDGQPNDRVQVRVPDRSVHFSKEGRFLLTEGASTRGGRLESLLSVVLLRNKIDFEIQPDLNDISGRRLDLPLSVVPRKPTRGPDSPR